jgi:hypothetical protein
VLLFQDLAVVVLLMLIPLLAPDPSGASSGGMAKIATVSAPIVVSALAKLPLSVAGPQQILKSSCRAGCFVVCLCSWLSCGVVVQGAQDLGMGCVGWGDRGAAVPPKLLSIL